MEEIWKNITDLNGYYQVSNKGNVRSITCNRCKGVVLKQQLSKKGYNRIRVGLPAGEKFSFSVHRLVAKSFIPNPNNLPQVNHKNGIKTDNRVENLEWCTRSYNVNYGSRIEKQRKALIKPVVAYSKAYEFVKEFDSLVDASKFAKVDATNISRACRKEGRISGGYLWKYKNIEK